MKLRLLTAATGIALVALAGTASARNPHCAGGIQYVVQGLRDKDKGNTEDYLREMNKAVDQLTQCASEDPADFEALGYLGWAYAELDSAGPAGEAFRKAADAAQAKGDKKKLETIAMNRDHYWSMAYNDGISSIKNGQDFLDAGDKTQAHDSFMKAADKLTEAKLLRPGHAQTLRNLATAYALDGDFDHAESVLSQGLTDAAADTSVHTLAEALRTVRSNKANELLKANKFDEAIAFYADLVKQDTGNSDLFMGLGSAYFSRAGTDTADAARKADFKSAADAYAKAYQLKSDDANLAFNAALAYQNSGDLGSAERQWRQVLARTPNDPDALSSLGSVLADEKKYTEALQVLYKAIDVKPDEKIYYRQLGAVYSKSGNNLKTTEMLMVYMAMNRGTLADDPAATVKGAKPGSAAANTAASMGNPEKIYNWDDPSSGKLQTWIYGKKKLAFTFNAAGVLAQKSDWSTAPTPAAPTK